MNRRVVDERRDRTRRGTDRECPRPASNGNERTVETLHRLGGNQALQMLYKHGTLQAKLAVARHADRSEREAERVATNVVTPSMAANDYGNEIRPLRSISTGTESVAGPRERTIRSLQGRGKPLPHGTRTYFESRLGRDFSDVRVHTGPTADEAARSIGAEAFTIGTDVAFATGKYRPGTKDGKRLLAHELTHVIQQSATGGVVQRQESSEVAQAKEWLELDTETRQSVKEGATAIAKKIAEKSLGGYYTAGEIATKLADAAIEGIGKGIEKAQTVGVEKITEAWGAARDLAHHGPDVTDEELIEEIRKKRSPTLNALTELNTVLTEMTVSVAKETVDIVIGHGVDFISGKLGEMVNAMFTDVLGGWGLFGWSTEEFVKEATDEQVKRLKTNMQRYLEATIRSALEDEGVGN